MVIWIAWITRTVLAIPLWVSQVAVDPAADAAPEATDGGATMMDQLTPINQIRVFMGLFTVLVLGLVIFLVIKAGAHMWRGISAAANRLPAESVPSRDDWTDKPLNELPTDAASEEKNDA